MKHKHIPAWLVVVAWSYLAGAQTTQSAGPAGAVANFRRGMDGIHPESVSLFLVADDEAGNAKISQLQQLADALGGLRAAVNAKFGRDTFYLADHPVQSMDEKINGDSADVTTPAGKVVHLRRVNGKWRIPVKQENDDLTQQHVAELQVMTEAIKSITADTKAGRFDTADEVLRAAQEELTRGRTVRHATTAATRK